MKYRQTSKFPRLVGGIGFYSVIAICLMVLGGVTWFAVSRYNGVEEKPNHSSYNSGINSDITPSDDPNEDVSSDESIITENSTENVPYEETPEEKKEPVTFVAPVRGNILKGFSETELQYSNTYGDMRLHTGIDMECEAGSDVKAASSGTVKTIGEDTNLGKYVEIEHIDGIVIKYCGFDTVSVSEGEKVSTGMVIGKSGNIPSECADKSHIHIEALKNGKKLSPVEIFAKVN